MEGEEKTPEEQAASTTPTVPRDALGRILPGHSLNPNGRVKGLKSLDAMLAELAEEEIVGTGKSTGELINRRLIQLALSSKVSPSITLRAIEMIQLRLGGSPKQHIETTQIEGWDMQTIIDDPAEVQPKEGDGGNA